ncbi:MAG TPA: HNH endonuclease [Elusimicrobiota bacterium]|nr:HNH endonuclease [Elusimicrobiota bacterium]
MDFKLRTNAKYFSDEEILADLRRVAAYLGKKAIGHREYLRHGQFSCKPFVNRFGSWNKAVELAGLTKVAEKNISTNMLFDNLEKVWLTLGRQPFYGEMRGPLSKYTTKPYKIRWGGWMKACEAFVRFKQNDPQFEKVLKPQSVARSRAISEKIRLQVLKCGNYKCQKCGRSPATHAGIFLHIDHKIPFSKGGSNDLENLQVLCNKCNLGKNNNENL